MDRVERVASVTSSSSRVDVGKSKDWRRRGTRRGREVRNILEGMCRRMLDRAMRKFGFVGLSACLKRSTRMGIQREKTFCLERSLCTA